MTHNPKQFAVVDPRSMDGNPYEVAERAVKQLNGLIGLALESLDDTRLMARNAAMERAFGLEQEPDAAGWDSGPEARRWDEVERALTKVQSDLSLLSRVVSFDPKHPPTA